MFYAPICTNCGHAIDIVNGHIAHKETTNMECKELVYIISLPTLDAGPEITARYNEIGKHRHEYHPKDPDQNPQCRWKFKFGDPNHPQGLLQCPAVFYKERASWIIGDIYPKMKEVKIRDGHNLCPNCNKVMEPCPCGSGGVFCGFCYAEGRFNIDEEL